MPKDFYETHDTRAAAETARDQLMKLLAMGVNVDHLVNPTSDAAKDPMLSQLIGDYEKKANVAPSDLTNLALVRSEVKLIRMSQLTYQWVDEYVRWLKGPDMNLAPGTIRKRVECLARAVDWHIRETTAPDQVARANPLRLLPKGYSAYSRNDAELAPARIDIKREVRLTPDQDARILAALDGVKRPDRQRPFTDDAAFKMFYQLIVDTGMRQYEAYRLTVDRIDFQHGFIKVEGSKGHRGALKPRNVPMKPALEAALKVWCKDKIGLVFPFWDGTQENRDKTKGKLHARFKGLFAYADVPDFTEHDLRHEAACRWVEMKSGSGWMWSETEICKIMGWSDTKMMLRYASLRGEDLGRRMRA